MKLTLIKPNIGRMEHSLYVDEGRMEPLPLAVLAGLTPSDVEVVLYDDRMEPIPYDEPTNLVAINVDTFTARRAYEISAEFRRRGTPVILGGMHPTLIPTEAAQYADSIFLGDAELLWPQVIADARRGRLQAVYRAAAGPPQPGGVLPRRDIFAGKGYLPLSLLQFGRGCNFDCTFCAVSVYFKQNHFYRRLAEVIREIEAQERRLLFFVDDNMLANHQAAKELFRALIPLKIRWVSQASLDMTQDLELMALMVKSGCLGHVVGFESISPDSLRSMQKRPNLPGFSNYQEQIKILRDFGLQTWAAFTIGHDYDTVESLRRTVAFALENRFAFAAFNVLMPYPGTPLYRRLQAEGRLLYDGQWWLHPAYRFNSAAFQPKLMSADELTEAGFQARASFNSLGSIIRRMFDRSNLRSLYRLGVYLTYAPLFRKEVFKKHGMRFGLD
jgi:radical SAM superfamily enzyme YgiQ (UPF0313 family)